MPASTVMVPAINAKCLALGSMGVELGCAAGYGEASSKTVQPALPTVNSPRAAAGASKSTKMAMRIFMISAEQLVGEAQAPGKGVWVSGLGVSALAMAEAVESDARHRVDGVRRRLWRFGLH